MGKLKGMQHTLVHVQLDVQNGNRPLGLVVVFHNTVYGFGYVLHDQI